MKFIKAVITDDEEAARNVLSQLLDMEFPTIEVVARCSDLHATIKAIKRYQPDVVFLDVQMPEYAGYEIIDFLEEINFEIIFVTAFNEYAIKAFDLNAIDYLVKPINRKRLAQAVEKLSTKLVEKKAVTQFHLLKQSIYEKKFDHIVIPELGRQTIIQLADIVAIEAQGSYSCIHLVNNKDVTVTRNIKQFEIQLSANSNFFRTHKSWIVNITHIRNYGKAKLEIQLTNQIISKLSKYRKEEFEIILKG